MRRTFNCKKFKFSLTYASRQLRSKKTLTALLLASVVALCIFGFLKPNYPVFDPTDVHEKPREIIINPGEVVEEVSNLTRFVKLNDFSNQAYVKPWDDEDGSDQQQRNNSLKNDLEKCPRIMCNKGVCFENMLCYKLPPLLPHFKNPCFYEKVSEDDSDQSVYKNYIIRRMVANVQLPAVQTFHQNWQAKRNSSDPQLRCLPYFFIIGMEKCGTTDLYQRINMHPEVALSLAKELQWWTRRRFFYFSNNTFPQNMQGDQEKVLNPSSLLNVPFKHYYAFFDNVADKINATTEKYIDGTGYHQSITGDGSPNTMYWNDFRSIFNAEGVEYKRTIVAHHIAAVLPKSKIIAILRNPTDRLYSSYLFFNRDASASKFHKIVTKGIDLFNKCLNLKALRDCVYDPQLKEQVGSTTNLMQGLYSVMLQDWLEVFPISQLHVVHFETYRRSEILSINEIFKFLGLKPVSADDQSGQRIMSKEKVFGGKHYERVGSMSKATRRVLDNFYRPFNEQLANLLNDTRYLWTDS